MSTTSIEWTDEVWNPTTGCDRVSPGCDNCYALTMAARLKGMGQAKYQRDGDPRTSGPGFGLSVHSDALDVPLRWRKPRRVFVNSMSDLFHPEVPGSFIEDVWEVMETASEHTFQVLTKRPQRMAQVVDRLYGIPDDLPIPNIWLGTSIESNRYAFRADHLRATPAAVRWISAEPLLGPLDELDLEGIDWLVAGGESGPGARPMHPAWVRDLRDRCAAAGVPFFFKQWGAWQDGGGHPSPANDRVVTADGEVRTWEQWNAYAPSSSMPMVRARPTLMARVGKRAAGRELDGRTHDEFPEVAA